MKTNRLLLSAAIAVALLSGCATQGSGNPGNPSVYSSTSVGASAQGIRVRVLGVERIKIEMPAAAGSAGQIFAATGGGILGGVLGNSIGQGDGKNIARVVGAIGGAAIGNSIANQKELRDGYRITFAYFRDGREVVENVKQVAAGPIPRQGDDAMLFRGGNAGDRITTL